VETLAKAFDYIIMDLPPINTVSDGLAVSKLLSGMIMVVRRDYCDHHSLAEAMRQLEFVKVRLLGFVFNGADSGNKRGGSKRKKYCRTGYGYGQRREQESTFAGSPADLAKSPDSACETMPGQR